MFTAAIVTVVGYVEGSVGDGVGVVGKGVVGAGVAGLSVLVGTGGTGGICGTGGTVGTAVVVVEEGSGVVEGVAPLVIFGFLVFRIF